MGPFAVKDIVGLPGKKMGKIIRIAATGTLYVQEVKLREKPNHHDGSYIQKVGHPKWIKPEEATLVRGINK